jgi:hypothetical protein
MMKMNLNYLAAIALIAFCFSACIKKPKEATSDTGLKPANSGIHEVVAEEVLDAMSYNYVKVREDGRKYWIAINKQPVEVGQTYFFEPEGLMLDFESKNLGRTFDSVYFVTKFSAHPLTNLTKDAHGSNPSDRMKTEKRGNITVERAEGGITIGELYANKDQYAGKEVIIRGVVVKYSMGIMNTNWAHIQDGTSNSDHYDLTVTTDELLKIGDVATFRGTIILDKDFGHGYIYDVLMEEAIQLDRKSSI